MNTTGEEVRSILRDIDDTAKITAHYTKAAAAAASADRIIYRI